MSDQTTMNPDGEAQPAATVAKKPKLSKVKKIIAAVVVFIVLIIAIAFYATSGVSQTSHSFVDKILQNNSSAAYELFSNEAKQTVTTEQFKEIVATISSVLDDQASQQSADVESGTDKGTSGTVVYEVEGSDGTYELTVNLIKEDNEWKVVSFESTNKK